MKCDLLISVLPREKFETTRRKQAKAKAKIDSVSRRNHELGSSESGHGLLHELIKEKTKKLLSSSGQELWEDDL